MVRLQEKNVSRCTRQEKLEIGTGVWHLRVKGTAEVDGTGDGGQLGQVNVRQLVVTADNETTVNLLESGDADVGQLGVVVKGQIGSGGQVGSGESLELSTPEAELALELLQRGHGHGADVAEGHVVSSAEIGKVNLELVPVTSEVDQVGGVLQVVDVDLLHVGVVGDLELADGLQGDTVEVLETSVGDQDITSFRNTALEVQGLKGGEGLPVDLTDGSELSKAQLGEAGALLQGETVADRRDFGGDDASKLSSVLGSDATGDLLDAVDGEVTTKGRVDLHVTAEGGAAGKGIGVALGLDGNITTG